MKLPYLRIRRIGRWLLATLLALFVFRDVNALIRKKEGQDAVHSDTLTGKVVLIHSPGKKRWRAIVTYLVFGIVSGFPAVALVIWERRYDNSSSISRPLFSDFVAYEGCSNLLNYTSGRLTIYYALSPLGIPGFLEDELTPQFVAPSDAWMPSDLELSMMASKLFQVEDLTSGALTHVGENAQKHSEQKQLEVEFNNANILIEGVRSQPQRDLNILYTNLHQLKTILQAACQRQRLQLPILTYACLCLPNPFLCLFAKFEAIPILCLFDP
jgi:hypothetical protein